MAKFRDMKTLQKFASVHASIHNHCNQDRHLDRRDIFKRNRAAALAEWRQLAAREPWLRAFCRPVRIDLTVPSEGDGEARVLRRPRRPSIGRDVP